MSCHVGGVGLPEEIDVAIIGAGAAGLAAAIYAGRSGLKTVVFDSQMVGGQTATSPDIENYPGFESISGPELMDKFKKHALKYSEIREWVPVEKIEHHSEGFALKTGGGDVFAKKVILTTGAHHRKLGVPGEEEFGGKGVSYCATCDGFFFKGKKVLQVGGGNTALTEAIYLLDAGVDVTIVHRRDQLRAEKFLQDLYSKKGGKVIWDSVVKEFKGEGRLKSAMLLNKVTGQEMELEVEGAFIAVGIDPANELAKSLDVKLDESGYILTDMEQRTNVPGIFAAGDNSIGLRQVVSGAGGGAQAAISAHNDITHEDWSQ